MQLSNQKAKYHSNSTKVQNKKIFPHDGILINCSHFPLTVKLWLFSKLHPKPQQDHYFPRRQGISHQGCKTTKPAYQYKLFITNKRGNTYKFPFSFFWILQFKSNISSACYQPEIYILHRFMSTGFIENNFHARPLDDP